MKAYLATKKLTVRFKKWEFVVWHFLSSYYEMVPNLASQEDEYHINNLSNIPHIEFDQRLVYQEAFGVPPFYHPK